MRFLKFISLVFLSSCWSEAFSQSLTDLVIDTIKLEHNTWRLTYFLGEDTISYGTVKEQMNHGKWTGLYRNGITRFTSSYTNGAIHGESNYYYPSGELKSTSHHAYGVRSNRWSSFYEDGGDLSQITWNSAGMPLLVEVYAENGITVLKKEFAYGEEECAISVKRLYRNGSPLETYTAYIKLPDLTANLNTQGLNYLLNTDPNFGLPLSSREENLSGYYYRYFNNGKLWMHLEFDEGRLLEVFTQNSSSETPIETSFNSGNGTLVHFHHYGDTAAVLNYTNGLGHGKLKYFYSGNNTHITGSMDDGKPDALWTTYSFSGQKKQTVNFGKDTVVWCLYGPKSNKYREYPLVSGLLNGTGREYDFYDQTAAEFSYSNGFLNGKHTRWLNGTITRYGDYSMGEQIGEWITPGLFNPISHTTSFRDKPVVYNSELLPRFDFNLLPDIEMPRLKLPKEYDIRSYSNELKLYTEDQFKTLLLGLPDSDVLIGTSFIQLVIDENGNLNSLDAIKSPSDWEARNALEFVIQDALFSTLFVHGLPDVALRYTVVEHFRE